MKHLKIFLLLSLLFSQASFAQDKPKKPLTSDYEIILKNNSYVLVPILVIGFAQWDWGNLDFNVGHEGFFEEDSRYGGADKMGHFYSSYLISDLLSKKFIADGINKNNAAIYGASSAFILTTLIELGDATTKKHGFSIQDELMNTLGALSSYILLTNPELDKKFDFKIDYLPTLNDMKLKGRLLDNYDRARYIASVKLGGFDFAENNFLKFVEIQVSYRATGYVKYEIDRSRDIGIGIAVNISEVLDNLSNNKANKYATGFFEYYQPRYTYVVHDKDLNR